ncbi:MAG: helix-turn-helix domain-containing protein [Bacilli bacterium]|nr:helix-turn-helix domain-containing protein [Bacilli bacterium]
MDQIKIGKFIAECRKKQNLTQAELAEKFNITDRAVSKWERGLTMPDSSIMLELCCLLEISVNDLLSGEVVTMSNYDEKKEQILLDMIKQKEENDKKLLVLEIVIGIFSMIILLGFCFVTAFFSIPEWVKAILIIVGFVLGLVGMFFGIKIEQTAGYYECGKCGHKYVPTFNSVLWAIHFGRTRYMKCPHCHKRSYNKKVISK